MKYVIRGNRAEIEYDPQEQAAIDRHRRNLRLKIAREAMFRAAEHYASLRALEGERRREEETAN